MKKAIESINDLKFNIKKNLGEQVGDEFFHEFVIPLFQFRIDTKYIISDIKMYKDLFITTVIPKSKNFYLVSLDLKVLNEFSERDDFLLDKENEMLQLAYVGLFHKLENYENKTLDSYNRLAGTNHNSLNKIEVDFSNRKELFNDRNRIRLICNSIKHNNAYPKKELKKYYPELDLEKQLSYLHLNFEEDIKLIIAYVHFFNLIIITKLLETFLNETDSVEHKPFKKAISDFAAFITIDESYKDPKYERAFLFKREE